MASEIRKWTPEEIENTSTGGLHYFASEHNIIVDLYYTALRDLAEARAETKTARNTAKVNLAGYHNAKAETAKLREALRRVAIGIDGDAQYECHECLGMWMYGDPENHHIGCLAAPVEEKL